MSIECGAIRALLYLYQDGSLESSDRERVARHLTICNDCQRDLLLMERIDEALSTESLIEVRADFTKAVMARIPVGARHPIWSWRKFLLWFGGYIVAVAAMYWTVTALWKKPVFGMGENLVEKVPSVVGRLVEGFNAGAYTFVLDVTHRVLEILSVVGKLIEGLNASIYTFGSDVANRALEIPLDQLEVPFVVFAAFLIVFTVLRATDAMYSRLELLR